MENSPESGISTMEKSSRIILTPADMSQFIKKEVSSRLAQLYSFTSYEELKSVIDSGMYDMNA
jgi:hypothetical protein